MVCGPESVQPLINKKIDEINANELCPPEEAEGQVQELILQILCVFFAILILVVLAKLSVDWYNYRKKGQLPWLALKMP